VNEGFNERVLDLVERIPPGRVLSYGLIAAILNDESGLQEGGPRQIDPSQPAY
jgi:alkylated DNA nucleotide flippase Atl1